MGGFFMYPDLVRSAVTGERGCVWGEAKGCRGKETGVVRNGN